MNDRFCFHTKKHFGSITYNEFMSVTWKLIHLCEEHKMDLEIKLFTCEDLETYQAAHVTIELESLTERSATRDADPLANFSETIWEEALEVGVNIHSPEPHDLFTVSLTCDRHSESSRLQFYGRSIPPDLLRRINKHFTSSSFSQKVRQGVF